VNNIGSSAFTYTTGTGGTESVGISWVNTSSTVTTILMGRYGSANLAGTGREWSTDFTGYSLVFIKGKIGSAVGFGAATQDRLGLVKAGQVPGTNTNDNAAVGYVGEFHQQSRLRSALLSLSNGTAANLTATPLTLGAGDWDIAAMVSFDPAASTNTTRFEVSISKTSATLSGTDTISVPTSGEVRSFIVEDSNSDTEDITMSIPSFRVSLSEEDILYLVVQSNFTTSTVGAYGSFWARRAR
jgi:hypothetical protein